MLLVQRQRKKDGQQRRRERGHLESFSPAFQGWNPSLVRSARLKTGRGERAQKAAEALKKLFLLLALFLLWVLFPHSRSRASVNFLLTASKPKGTWCTKKKKKEKSCLPFRVFIEIASKLCFLWFPVVSLCAAIYKCTWMSALSKAHVHTYTRTHIQTHAQGLGIAMGAELVSGVIPPPADGPSPPDVVQHLVDAANR